MNAIHLRRILRPAAVLTVVLGTLLPASAAETDDGLTLEDFRRRVSGFERLQSDNASAFAFNQLDRDNDGTLDRREQAAMRRGLQSMRVADEPADPVAGPRGRNPMRLVRPSERGSPVQRSEERPGDADWWSLNPVTDPTPPAAGPGSEDRDPIDRFIDAGIADAGLTAAGPADRATLVRRVHLDLTGLPPEPEVVLAATRSRRSDAEVIADVVDRCLDSDAFGEHWGRHWLDLARYAESSGKEVNVFYPFAWRYRDWVIDAINDDMPYDDFLRRQITGDLMPARDDAEASANIVATGYLAIGPKSHGRADVRQFGLDVADEQIDTLTRGVLGITVACARCHDHPFDPISQDDYTAMAGVLASTETLFGSSRAVQNNRANGLAELRDASPGSSIDAAHHAMLVRQVEMLSGEGAFDPGKQIRLANARSTLSHFDDRRRQRPLAMAVRESDPVDLPRLDRGELDGAAGRIARGVPMTWTAAGNPTIPRRESGRRQLADWIADDANPLTARVMVNRVWQHLMGVGLVDTPDNFGTTGSTPTHPELLDHLATRFMADGWSLKTLIRDIVATDVYRRATTDVAESSAVDPENRLRWRQDRRRLTAEQIHDSMLTAAGDLKPERPVGSPVAALGDGQVQRLDRGRQMIRRMRPRGTERQISPERLERLRRRNPEVARRIEARMKRRRDRDGLAGSTVGSASMMGAGSMMRSNPFAAAVSLPVDPRHRAVYNPVLRDRPDDLASAFHVPDPSLVTGRRETVVSPDQSLWLSNGDFAHRRAASLADELRDAPEHDRVDRAYLRTLSRLPTEAERRRVAAFVESSPTSVRETWIDVALALFSHPEFLHRG